MIFFSPIFLHRSKKKKKISFSYYFFVRFTRDNLFGESKKSRYSNILKEVEIVYIHFKQYSEDVTWRKSKCRFDLFYSRTEFIHPLNIISFYYFRSSRGKNNFWQPASENASFCIHVNKYKVELPTDYANFNFLFFSFYRKHLNIFSPFFQVWR